MKLIIIGMFIALMALGTSCAQMSQPVAEVAPQATSDGIKVHGDWTVTVTNPDGTVDAVHEFENELTALGGALLAAVLMKETEITSYRIILSTLTGTMGCIENTDGNNANLPTKHQWDLEAAAVRDFDVVMLGTTCTVKTVKDSIDIKKIMAVFDHTLYKPNPNDESPTAGSIFTIRHLDNPITAINNQVLGVNVVISFE